ncbi:MAG: ATP-dependent helicase [Desulfobulbaceae bacterium]|nr:ATP-dependent helicase [Desulfobulbaceae bacterium]
MQRELFPHNDNATLRPGSPINREALNQAQYDAVTHGSGPLLVIAGAGSGKTRTLVYRVAYLIEQQVEPESILLLTFTRRAAQEMLQRAGRISDQSCRRVMGGTFHATSNMLLRRHGHHLGFSPGFTIIDRGDAEGIINLIKSSLGLSGAGKRFPTKRMIMNILSGAVNKSRSIEDLVYDQHLHLSEFLEDLYRIQDHYARFKVDHGLMDYDDLLVNWHRLLTESPEARREVTSRFSHILVDEYQDTNLLQAEIVRLLAHDHDNVMVVGDDSQSIYSFRGADFYNIMRFPDQFPGATVIKLEENYRSTQPILTLTNSIIACAEEKFTKTLFTSVSGGVAPVLFTARNEGGEARFIVDTMDRLIKEGSDISDIAVLFRSGYHSYKLEMELTSRYIDFEKRGGLKLTESAHIKDVLSFFRVLVNPLDNLSWNRILLQLDKVGPKTAQKILDYLKNSDDPIAALSSYKPGRTWQEGFTRLAGLMRDLLRPDLTPAGQFDLVLEYYEPVLEKVYYDDYPKRKKDIDQLKSIVAGYGDLQSLIDDTTLDPPETGQDLPSSPDSESGKLVLSTIHSAKGLEWDTVFVIGLAEGRFPHQNTTPGEQWEEERRLLYVAATRAKRNLYFTYPQELISPDRQVMRTVMSPFLREINPGLYIRESGSPTPAFGGFGSEFPSPRTSGIKPPSRPRTAELAVGAQVRHPFFGRGQVKNVPGPRRVEISFDRHGDKILHLDYAKLEIIA